MQGQLSATPDRIGWVLTSAWISSGIRMPLTGHFSDRLGQRNYLTLGIAALVLASALCGVAANLDEIVILRLLQGVPGAGLVPLAQAVTVNIHPVKERGKAMAIFGAGPMVGTIPGPTPGGYLTQVLSWRWTFYINVPVGLCAFFGVGLAVVQLATVGVATGTALMAHQGQIAWNQIGANRNPFNPALRSMPPQLRQAPAVAGALLGAILHRQSSMRAMC